ncbi:hypothetical protein ACEPAI_5491 [Sanghuangporus weigelae]
MVAIPDSSASEASPPPDVPESSRDNAVANTSIRIQALTARQERRLVEYVEDMFLDIMRNYKKRDHPSTTLPTLHSYLRATHTLLSLILQIPPVVTNQASLRTALLLRFSSETLAAITHYPRPILNGSRTRAQSQSQSDAGGAETLKELLDWLDELDKGWHVVLCSQAWDTSARDGVDVYVDFEPDGDHLLSNKSDVDEHLKSGSDVSQTDEDYSPASLGSTSSALSQTDRTRLRSLLLSGSSALEEWLEGIQAPPSTAPHRANGSSFGVQSNRESLSDVEMDQESESNNPEDDLETTLEHLGLQQAFDDLFSRTLTSMGELGGEVLSAGEELEME